MRIIISLLTVVLVTGCSSDSDDVPESGLVETFTVGGDSQLGRIGLGDVTVRDATLNSIATGTTDAAGEFGPLSLPLNFAGIVIVEISPAADGSSFFTCDFPNGCPDPAGGAAIPFGSNVPYTSTLSAILPTIAGAVGPISVNALTTAVRARVDALGGPTDANIAQANAEMQAQLSLLLGVQVTTPLTSIPNYDLVNNDNNSGDVADDVAINVAAVNAGLMSLVSPGGGFTSLNDVISSLSSEFASGGSFESGTAVGSGRFTASEVVFTAQQTFSGLEASQPSVVAQIESAVSGFDVGTQETVLTETLNDIVSSALEIGGTSPILQALEDEPFSFTPTVTGAAEEGALEYFVQNAPGWTSFDSATGTLSGTPTNDNLGSTTGIIIRVVQGVAQASTPAFSIQVANSNDIPTIEGTPVTTATEGVFYQFQVTGSDDDGDQLTFFLDGAPAWLGVDANGLVSGTPGDNDVGVVGPITVGVRDQNQTSAILEPSFNITVANVNDNPVGTVTITGAATENVALMANTAGLSDADGLGTFTYSWRRNMVAVPNTNNVAYTLDDIDVGTQIDVVVSYTDGQGTPESVTSAQTAVVANVNDAATGSVTFTGAIQEDSVITAVTSTVLDDDGFTGPVSTYQWRRGGAVIPGANSSTFQPGDSEVGLALSVDITFTDDRGSAESASGNAGVVVNVNDPPVISGTPETIAPENIAYSFLPAVSDVDPGDTTTFSFDIQPSQPMWMMTNTNTGLISGTPTNGDVGDSYTIIIDVTDSGGLTDALPSFQLDVVQGVPITVQWTTPTTRTNGQPLDFADILGYEIVYNLVGDPDVVEAICDPGQTSFTTPPLPLGNYEFKIKVLDRQGQESAFSMTLPASNAPPP